MKIVVCIRQVPKIDENLAVSESRLGLKEDHLKWVINEWDECAVEEALLLREKHGGNVTVISVGPVRVEDSIYTALARGADRGVRIDAPSNLDGWAIASLLAPFVRAETPDLVLTGVMGSDDGTAQVGGFLAHLLDIPHASVVIRCEFSSDRIIVDRELEGGIFEKLSLPLPALLTIQTGINQPRYTSMLGLRQARRKELKVAIASACDAERTEVLSLSHPEQRGGAQFIDGNAHEKAQKLVDLLFAKGVLS